jgi:hypothetical protein
MAVAQSDVFRASFSETTESRPTGLAVDDLDNDGVMDLVVTTPDTRVGTDITSAVTVLQGQGDGEFFIEHKIVVNGFPSTLLLAPLDGDAIPDLMIADSNGGSIFFLKGLDNTDYFDAPGTPIDVGGLPEGIAAAHLDDDAVLDLVVANRESSSGTTPGSVSILRGQGDGTFVTVLQLDPTPEDPDRLVSALATDLGTMAVALGDLNDDDFVDIAALNSDASSITFFFGDGDLVFGGRTTIPIGAGPEDILLVDLNGDGALDVITADSFADQDGAVSVLLGNGNGTFQAARSFQAGNTPNGVAVGDLNGDGALDIVASNGRSSDISVLLGDGSGQFQDARTYVADAEPLALALADMDDNDSLDVVAITAAESGTASLLLNRGDGVLNGVEDVLVGVSPSALTSGDIDDDAIPDLVVGTSTGNVVVYSSRGQEGGFAPIQSIAIGGTLQSIAAVDLDGDAVLDLAIADRDGDRVVVVMGLGGGQFAMPIGIQVEERPSSVASGDFNADGRVDLAVTTIGPPDTSPPSPMVTALLRQADGTYTVGTPVDVEETPLFVVAADFNGDGRDDLAVANQATSTVSVLFSEADGSLDLNQTLMPNEVGQQPSSLTVADFNLDGRPDIAVADFLAGVSPSTVRIFLAGTDGLLAFDRSLNAGNSLSGIVARDFTGDSLYDIMVVQNTANQVSLFYDQGDRRFRSRLPDTVSRRPISITVADFNDDGRYDVATGNEDASANNISVLTNCIRDQDCAGDNVFPGGVSAVRGDANGDASLSAADIVAVALEVVDDDGMRVEDIARPEQAGYQAASGVDANGDGRVDRQDRTAVVRRLFAS